MSDPENDKKKPEEQTEVIQDAVIIEEDETATDETDTPQEDTTADISDAPVETPDPAEDEPEAEVQEEDAAQDAEDAPKTDAEPEETEPAPETEPVSAPTPEPTVVRRGGFVPMVLGGVVAAGLGFGASQVLFPDGMGGSDRDSVIADLTASVQQQGAQVARLTQELDAVKSTPVDLSPVDDLAELVDQANGDVAQLSEQLSALDARLTTLEKRPADDAGGVSAAAAEAYEREVAALREAMEKQKAEIAALMNEAQEKKASAELTAKQAMIRTAVSRIQVAMDTGKEFAGPVADLVDAGVSVPAVLSDAAETGIPTLAQLNAEYPAAARKALAVARKTEGTGGKALDFLRNQLGVRSLEPKEGPGTDAVLSRAEAALKDGRLTDTLAELQALPELARVELTDWMAMATVRTDALAAAETLSATVASN